MFNSENIALKETYRMDLMPQESLLDSPPIINYSIWKMDVASHLSTNSNVYIAFSIYAYRSHSIYLTSLTNIKELANEQRKLTLDSGYGTIVDYCFPPENILYDDYQTNSKCYLYILFDSNMLIKVDIISILLRNNTELFVQSDETIQEINNILATKEFQLIDYMNSNRISDEIMFKQLFNNRSNFNDNVPQKRKTEKLDQQQRKKQASFQIDESDEN